MIFATIRGELKIVRSFTTSWETGA